MSQEDSQLFELFFASGMEETNSPFLTAKGRTWGKSLHLKLAAVAAVCLALAWVLPCCIHNVALEHLLLLFTYFFAGTFALIKALEDLLHLRINIDVLMTLAAFSSCFLGSPKEGALLLVLFSLSAALEKIVRFKAKSALAHLQEKLPSKANVIVEEHDYVEKSLKQVLPGSLILVKPGEIVPLDGVIVEGSCLLEVSHLTGEKVPHQVKVGDSIFSGGKNLDGILKIKTTKASHQSTLAYLIDLITQAQKAKPNLQRWIDRFSSKYATLIIALSAAIALLLPWLYGFSFLGMTGSIYRALTFLIAASPCALILAMPIAYLSAINACTREGIILKGGYCLDALSRCNMICFDKTGTLTQGNLSCVSIQGADETAALHVAYGLEQYSTHPIAQAIQQKSQQQQIKPALIEDLKVYAGSGIEGMYQSQLVRIGNADFIIQQQPCLAESIRSTVDAIQQQGYAYALLLHDQKVTFFTFHDVIRPGIKQSLIALHQEGKKLCMLTGDHQYNAAMIASELGLTHFFAHLSPEDKLHHIETMSLNYTLAMVGDGMNDAPALSRAMVGIAMGKIGSGIAIAAADIILLQDNIEKLPWLVRKARITQQIVFQNLCLSCLAIICATTCSLWGIIPLWLAVVLHEGSTLLVGLNALRLLRRKK